MITKIDIFYDDVGGEQNLELPIVGLKPKDGLLVRRITGLDPSDVDLFMGAHAKHGSSYQGRRARERNIVMTIDLNPDYSLGQTVASLREQLYKVFLDPYEDSDYVPMHFHISDGRILTTYGYTEKLESELFGSETEMQVSMLCPDPFLRSVQETDHTNSVGLWLNLPFIYEGTAPTGFFLDIGVTSSTTKLVVDLNGQKMEFLGDFLADDTVHISTVDGQKYARLIRDSETTSLLPNLTPTSRWIEIKTKNNTLSVYGVDQAPVPAGIQTLKYRSSYRGA